MEMETYYWSSRWKLSEVLGWSSRVKQQHIFSSTWTCSHSDTSSMVMREMNSESLGRLSSCPCVCVCVCTRVCVCVQLLSWPLRPLLCSTKQQSMTHTSWICTHLHWERRPVPMRQGEREERGGGGGLWQETMVLKPFSRYDEYETPCKWHW